MRSFKHLLLSAVFMTAFSGVYAQGSYIGFGLGLQDDLGQLTNTIVVDGLNSSASYPTYVGRSAPFGCGSSLVISGQANPCYVEGTGGVQKAIISENTLIGLEKNTAGLVRSKTSGGMIGGVLAVFYEGETESGLFYRAGFNYTKKILGGKSESYLFKGSPFEIKWYDIEWDYYAWHIPLYFGLKAGIGESASVYGGAGINYATGGWNLGGTNNGDYIGAILGLNQGLQTTVSQSGAIVQLPAYKEAAKFRVAGFGYQFMIGVETKLESGNKLFFEIETIKAGAQGTTPTTSDGGQQALADLAVYPISLSGTNFKFGYKLAL